MNELCQHVLHVRDNDTLILQQGRTYHVRPEDSFNLVGYHCSNSADKSENPDGVRYSAVYLKNKRNVVIDGNGATLMIHGKMTPFLFDACENITVKNLTGDYACPIMTEFTVLSNENGVCDIRFHPDCRFRFDYLREAEIIGNTFDAPMTIRTHRSGTVIERDNEVTKA